MQNQVARIQSPDFKVKQITVDQISRNFLQVGPGDSLVKLLAYFIVDQNDWEINRNGFVLKVAVDRMQRSSNFIKKHFKIKSV